MNEVQRRHRLQKIYNFTKISPAQVGDQEALLEHVRVRDLPTDQGDEAALLKL